MPLNAFYLLLLFECILIAAFAQRTINDDLRAEWSDFSSNWKSGEFDCKKRRYPNESSFVCVCDSAFCDEIEPVGELPIGHIIGYASTPDKFRLKRFLMQFNNHENDTCGSEENCVKFFIDISKTKQKIFGFGSTFTDAAGINFEELSEKTRRRALESYFGEKGIGYTIGRVPIASCDFSTRVYSYDDSAGDFELKNFSLALEDFKYKIPYILNATKLSGGRLKLFASPWSAPGWMKTNKNMIGDALLDGPFNGNCYQAYANYFVKFFEEYSKHNVTFWGLTILSEPVPADYFLVFWQTMRMDLEMQREFARVLLAPALRSSPTSANVKIMAYDGQGKKILEAARKIYNLNYSAIDGLGMQWYSAKNYEALARTHELQPNKFIFSTETCAGTGYVPDSITGPRLGDWGRGLMYGTDILNNLLNWVIAWTDLNLALDLRGGPNWVSNFVDAPLIVNATTDEFYRQPMFYFMGHFSKFIPRGSVALNVSTSDKNDVQMASFRTPDGSYASVVISTLKDAYRKVVIRESSQRFFTVVVPPQAIFTFLWN